MKTNDLKYFSEVDGLEPRIFYHYTSLEALYNIVQSKTFRLTSLRSSNDRKELSYNRGEFLKDFKTVCENEKDENTRLWLNLFAENVDKNTAKFFKECAGKHTPYALCLSKKRDNLTHWARYASNCTGVCIGFNISALDVLYRRARSPYFGSTLLDVEDVIYTQDTLLPSIRNNLLQIIIGLFESAKSNPSIDPKTIVEKAGYVYLGAVYQKIMKFVKNGSFVDEDEIRIYYETETIPNILSIIDSMTKDVDEDSKNEIRMRYTALVDLMQIQEERFMMTGSGIRSYHELCLDDIWGSGVIPEIILGSMCTQNRKDLERFLTYNGLKDTKVRISKIPIR